MQTFSEIDAQPVTMTFQCPFCKRSFETETIRMLAPKISIVKQLVCEECTTNYESKIQDNFRLNPEHEDSARRVGKMPESNDKKLILHRWRRFAEVGSIYSKCKYAKMVEIAEQQIPGTGESQSTRPTWERRK